MSYEDELCRAVRVIVFTGRRSWMEKQLGQSLNDGVKLLPDGMIQTYTVCEMQSMEEIWNAWEERKNPDHLPNLREDRP